MIKYGIDVSEFNGAIDWDKVRASGKVDFAIIRCSLGWTDGNVMERRDKRFQDNVFGCEMNGIPYGLYHYSYCLKPENEQKEAEFVLRNIEGSFPTLGVWYDIEDNAQIPLGKKKLTAMAKVFCDTLKAGGREPGVYSYKAFLENYLDMSQLKEYPTWLAQTDVKQPTYKGDWKIWQYSWKGQIPGINGDVDLNQMPVAIDDYSLYNKIAERLNEVIKELQEIRNSII